MHYKVWMIKYTNFKHKSMIRIVITTANLDNASWNIGTNMFWSDDF